MKGLKYFVAFAAGVAVGALLAQVQKGAEGKKESSELTASVKNKLYALEARDYDFAESKN